MIPIVTVPRLRRPAFVTSAHGLATITARAWPGLGEGDGRLIVRPLLLSSGAGFYTPAVAPGLVSVGPFLQATGFIAYPPPVIAAGTAIIPPALLSTVTGFTPSVQPGAAAVLPALLGSLVATFVPSVQAQSAGTILPPALASSSTTFFPVVQPGAATIGPALLGVGSAGFAPFVQAPAAGAILPALLAATSITFPPAIQPDGVAIQPLLLASAAAFYAPVVQMVTAGTVQPIIRPSSVVVFPLSLAAGTVTVAAPVLASGAQQFVPVIQPGVATAAPAALASTAGLYAPSVLPGSATVTAPARASAAAAYAPVVQPGSAQIAPALLASTAASYPLAIQAGSASILPALLGSTALTRAPAVSVAGGNGTLNAVTVTDGDSWFGTATAQYPANAPYAGKHMGAYFAANPTHIVNNMALSGSGLQHLRDDVAGIIAAKPYVVVLSCGRNDFMNDTSGQGYTDAQLLTAYSATYRGIIDDIRAGLPGVAIAVETITENHDPQGDINGVTVRYNNNRKALNSIIRQWKTDGVIAQVIDIGADAVIGRDGGMLKGSPESSDGLHLSEGSQPAGEGYAIPVFAAAMNALYAATPLPSSSSGDTYVSDYALTGSPSVTEGNSGTVNAVFTVTRTGALTRTGSVDWAVTGSGANPANASDFAGGVLPSGTLNFAANESSKTISVPIQGDAGVEADETFTVTLSNAKTTGNITSATAIGTIVNDDVGGGGSVTYAAGTPGTFTNTGGSTQTVAAQSLQAGRLALFVKSDYDRAPNTIVVKRSGQPDIMLTKQGAGTASSVWLGDIPADTSDYSIVFTRTTAPTPLIIQGFIPILVKGANGTPTQYYEQTFGPGNDTNVTMTTTLNLPTNGLALRFAINDIGNASGGPATLTNNDGGTTIASGNFTNFDGGATLFTVATLPASAKPSVGFAGSSSYIRLTAIAFGA